MAADRPDGPPAHGDAPQQPVSIPHTELSPEALRGLIEAFVLREGTEYGTEDVSLVEKVAQVLAQLRCGEAVIVFDPASGSVNIMLGAP